MNDREYYTEQIKFMFFLDRAKELSTVRKNAIFQNNEELQRDCERQLNELFQANPDLKQRLDDLAQVDNGK